MQTPQSQSASSSQRRRAQPWGSAVGEVGLQRQFAGQACSSLAQEKGSQWPSAPQRASGPQGSVSAAVQGAAQRESSGSAPASQRGQPGSSSWQVRPPPQSASSSHSRIGVVQMPQGRRSPSARCRRRSA